MQIARILAAVVAPNAHEVEFRVVLPLDMFAEGWTRALHCDCISF